MLNVQTAASRPRASTPDLIDACRQLVRRVEHLGYGDLVASASPLRFADPKVLRHVDGGLGPSLAAMFELLYLGRAVARDVFERIVGADAVEALWSGGILRSVGEERVATSGLTLTHTLGFWYFYETPTANPTLYFGEDSVALAWRQRRCTSGRVLDLCSGPGVQLLSGVRHGATGVGVEINRFAGAMARVNAGINGLEKRVEIRVGNLYEPVRTSERFDLILANPPFLPCPPDVPYAFIGAGGADGLDLTWTILEGLDTYLAPGGAAQIVGATFGDGVRLCVEPRLERWAKTAGMQVMLTVVSAFAVTEGAPMLEICAGIGTDTTPLGQHKAAKRFREVIAASGSTHLCGYFMHVRRGEGGLTVVDVASSTASNMFFI